MSGREVKGKKKRRRDPIKVVSMSGAVEARDWGRREAVTGSLLLNKNAHLPACRRKYGSLTRERASKSKGEGPDGRCRHPLQGAGTRHWRRKEAPRQAVRILR